MSYDPVQRVVVLFGGANTTDPDIWLTDTWEYDVVTKTWSQTGARGSGPMMYNAPLTYDATQLRHVTFGWNVTNSAMQTWAYDASMDAWEDRSPGVQPDPRSGHMIAYHAARNRVVLFGGGSLLPPPQSLADTWEYDYASNGWTSMSVSGPPGRASHAMTYRPAASSVLLFGGQGDAATFSDTWRYTSSGTW